MSYSSEWGAVEYANKQWYEFFENDSFSKDLLEKFRIKHIRTWEKLKNDLKSQIHSLEYKKDISKIKTIVSADGGYTFTDLKYNTSICFIKFWLYSLDLKKYRELEKKEVFSTKEYNSLWSSEICGFPYPSKNIQIKDLSKSNTINYIFSNFIKSQKLESTLDFLFNETYNWVTKGLSQEKILIQLELLYTLDINRSISYILSIVEQLLIFKKLINYYLTDIKKLSEILFIRDWFLGIVWGKEWYLVKQIEKFLNYLISSNIEFYLVWIEKSGMFKDFSKELKTLNLLDSDKVIIPSHDFVRKNIIFTQSNKESLYTTWKYYSGKVIAQIGNNNFILNLPMKSLEKLKENPWITDFNKLLEITTILKWL